MFNRSSWYEAKREEIREICLEQKNALLWDFVNRNMFEEITSSKTDAADRSHYLQALYNIATLFYYEADEWRDGAPRNQKT